MRIIVRKGLILLYSQSEWLACNSLTTYANLSFHLKRAYLEVAAYSVWLACNALTIYASLSVYIYFVHEIDSICELLS